MTRRVTYCTVMGHIKVTAAVETLRYLNTFKMKYLFNKSASFELFIMSIYSGYYSSMNE